MYKTETLTRHWLRINFYTFYAYRYKLEKKLKTKKRENKLSRMRKRMLETENWPQKISSEQIWNRKLWSIFSWKQVRNRIIFILWGACKKWKCCKRWNILMLQMLLLDYKSDVTHFYSLRFLHPIRMVKGVLCFLVTNSFSYPKICS